MSVPAETDPAPDDVSGRQPNADLAGKLKKWKLLEEMYLEQFEKCNQLSKKLDQEKLHLQSIKLERSNLYQELKTLKEKNPDLVELQSFDIGVHCEQEEDSTTAEDEAFSGQSPTELLLNAARRTRQLEDRGEIMQSMLSDKKLEREALTKQIQDGDANVKKLQERISELNCDIEKLELKVPTPEPRMPDLDIHLGDVSNQSPTYENTSDPEHLKRKIRELRSRLSQLLELSKKWSAECERLRVEVEQANIRFAKFQKEAEEKLQEEREKATQAEKERDRMEAESKKFSDEVKALEEKVRQLEHTLNNGHGQQRIESSTESDETLAYKTQINEYKQELEAERKDHDRTKEQVKSLNQQWQTVFEELRTKIKQLEKAKMELHQKNQLLEKYKRQLQQNGIDIQLIEDHMAQESQHGAYSSTSSSASAIPTGHGSPFSTTRERTSPRDEKPEDQKLPKKGMLETDQVIDYAGSGERRLPKNSLGNSWTCGMCTFVNSNPYFSLSCEICHTTRKQDQGHQRIENGASSDSRSTIVSRLETDGVPYFQSVR